MEINIEKLKATSTEELVKRKQEILSQAEAGREEVHAINGVLHGRNMKIKLAQEQKKFMEANKVTMEDLK